MPAQLTAAMEKSLRGLMLPRGDEGPITAARAHSMLTSKYGDEAPSLTAVRKWLAGEKRRHREREAARWRPEFHIERSR